VDAFLTDTEVESEHIAQEGPQKALSTCSSVGSTAFGPLPDAAKATVRVVGLAI